MKKKVLNSKSSFKKWGILSGIGQAVFVGLVMLLISGINNLNGEFLGGFVTSFLFFLLFFILCVVISVVLIFGRPIYLLLSKNYSEAVATLLVTVLTLLLVAVLVFGLILIF